VWLCVPIALFANRHAASVRVYWLVGETTINLCIAAIVHRVVTRSETLSGRVLNWRPLAFVGVLSYSIYLWQQPFLNRASTSFACTFPQALLFVFAAALASYGLVEKPFLKLRQRTARAPAPAEAGSLEPRVADQRDEQRAL
jgi:peptidoglycan/LPS O-acetylase OafA/YrhL